MGAYASIGVIFATLLVGFLLMSSNASASQEAEASKAFLEAKAQEEGVYKLPSGMYFKVLKKGTGEKSPSVSDPCDVHYEGTLRTGKVFDSSYKRGQPATFAPNQVIKGWTEALQMMREGDEWEVYIPSDLAYGSRGAGGLIPADAALTFKMALIKVKATGKPASEADKIIQDKVGRAYADL